MAKFIKSTDTENTEIAGMSFEVLVKFSPEHNKEIAYYEDYKIEMLINAIAHKAKSEIEKYLRHKYLKHSK